MRQHVLNSFHRLSLAGIVLLSLCPAQAETAVGIVETPNWDGPCDSTCGFPPHQIFDLCQERSRFNPADLLSAPVLDAFVCRHVQIEGPPVCGACCSLYPVGVVETQPLCGNEIRSLRFVSAHDFIWEVRPCAVSYDVIRGSIPSDTGPGTLGTVTCLRDDLPQPTACEGYEQGFGDTEIPAEGQAYFYLVRANGAPYGGDSYGRTSDGTERTPAEGDCP